MAEFLTFDNNSVINMPRLIAQDKLKHILERIVRTGRLPHAYLFLGPEGSGKEAAALDLAQILLCAGDHAKRDQQPGSIPCGSCDSCVQAQNLSHPNMKILFPLPKPKEETGDGVAQESYTTTQEKQIKESLAAKAIDAYSPLSVIGGQEILIEHIRALRHEFRLTSYSGGWRIVIISQADRLRIQAANAFLKLLEEPPPNVLFILTSSRESRLLPTIVSRCQVLRFPPLGEDILRQELEARKSINPKTASASARLAGGSWPRALKWTEEDPTAEISRGVEILRSLVKGDPGTIERLADELTGSSESDFPGLLRLLASWLRDVQRFDAAPDEHQELARDEALIKFADFCRGRNFADAIEAIENARLDLERRVQPQLVAHGLLIRLWRILFAKDATQDSIYSATT